MRVLLTYFAERGLVKDHSTFGEPVAEITAQELTREAAYLKQRNLITAIDIEEAEPGFLQSGIITMGEAAAKVITGS